MSNFLQMNIFFFIASLGFIVMAVLVSILLFHCIRAMRSFSRIIRKAERDIDKIGDTTKEFLEDVRDSSVFNLVVGKRKKTRKI